MNETKKKQKVEAEGKRVVCSVRCVGRCVRMCACMRATRMDVYTTQHTRNKEREYELRTEKVAGGIAETRDGRV